MKNGLKKIPTDQDLAKAYAALRGALGAGELAAYSQWTRFDPRLAEIWVKAVLERWKSVHPIELHESLKREPWPGAAGVLLEFVARAVRAEPAEARLFKLWKEMVLQGFGRAPWEQYFIGQRRIAGKAMIEDARFSLSEYRKWGYLGREILFNKQAFPPELQGTRRGRSGGGTHSLALEVREGILKELLRERPRITTRDYIQALGNSISPRQAERDLLGARWLMPVGNTKGRSFVRRRGSRA
jgi:hypothetical protein